MMRTTSQTTWASLGAALAFLFTSYLQSPAQALLLDDFSSGNVVVSNTVWSSSGDPVEGVFGGWRAVLLTKEIESSATFISIGSGVLTWNQTGEDSSFVGYRSGDLSGYDAFRLTVVSAPLNAGGLEVALNYSVTNHGFQMRVPAPLPPSGTGTVEVAFSSFFTRIADAGWPPIDMTAVGVALELRGGHPDSGRTQGQCLAVSK
jgi:hypothetical protein